MAVATLALTIFATAAQGGARIGKLGACANSYEFFAHGTGSVKDFRAALLCLINEARATQKLPPLKRSGQHQPSSNGRPAATCPHKPPAPIVTGMPVVAASPAPTATGSTVTLGLHCAARAACTLTSTLTLPDAHSSADSGIVTIPAGTSKTIAYTFAQTSVTAERAASNPSVSLSINVTAPVPYMGTIAGPLQ